MQKAVVISYLLGQIGKSWYHKKLSLNHSVPALKSARKEKAKSDVTSILLL